MLILHLVEILMSCEEEDVFGTFDWLAKGRFSAS
jgi:hypothetical protein